MRFNDNGVIGEISSLPGCSQIAIFHYVFIPTTLEKGKGLGTKAHAARLKRVKELGYDSALCTVGAKNEVELHILRNFGWKFLSSFKSTKTGHTVCLYGIGVEAGLNLVAPPIKDTGETDKNSYYEDLMHKGE